MIEDFKQPSGRQPARLDSARSYRPGYSNAPAADSTAAQNNSEPIQSGPSQPVFRTPEEVAGISAASGADNQTATSQSHHDELLLSAHATAGKKSFLSGTVRLFRKWDVSKKKLLAASAAALVLLGGGTAYAFTHASTAPAAQPVATTKAVAKPAPKPIVSPLTGLTVSPEQQKLPVIGVMIENSPDARPQSGLKDAGVVFEAIAEAGITRFLALFQESHPGNVGPVRSARPYYLDWAMAFNAGYAHVGGSPDALQRIKDIQVRDLDQFFNPAAYHRVTSRYAPHNVYTSVDQLTALAAGKGYTESAFTSFVRKAENPYKPATAAPTTGSTPKSSAANANRTAANTIDLTISSAYYNAHYAYDGSTNSYKRSEGGAPHMDADSNTQLAPKVVVALVMPYSLMADGYHSAYATQGSGKMYVFQDGTVTTGTWTKGEPSSQFVFKDDAGADLALNPGQTWISMVGDASKVSYQ